MSPDRGPQRLRDDGRLETTQLPERLPSNKATVVQTLGTVYFGSTYSFDDLLPDFTDAHNAILIIRMRGRESLDATSIGWLEDHVAKLKVQGNRLMLCDVEEPVLEQLKQTEAYELIGEENIFPAEPVHEASVEKALAAAEKWMAENQQAEEAD